MYRYIQDIVIDRFTKNIHLKSVAAGWQFDAVEFAIAMYLIVEYQTFGHLPVAFHAAVAFRVPVMRPSSRP